ALLRVARPTLPPLVFRIVLSPSPINPPAFYRTVVIFSVLPALGAWIVGRAARGTLAVDERGLRLARPGVRVDVPASAVGRVVPWRIPLPRPGFSLVTSSGRRLGYGLQMRDPAPALLALVERGGIEVARAALGHTTVVYARAKAAAGRRRWYHLVAKFPLFALAPAAVLFNAHQH